MSVTQGTLCVLKQAPRSGWRIHGATWSYIAANDVHHGQYVNAAWSGLEPSIHQACCFCKSWSKLVQVDDTWICYIQLLVLQMFERSGLCDIPKFPRSLSWAWTTYVLRKSAASRASSNNCACFPWSSSCLASCTHAWCQWSEQIVRQLRWLYYTTQCFSGLLWQCHTKKPAIWPIQGVRANVKVCRLRP